MKTRRRLLTAGVTIWGLLLAVWLSRVFFLHAPDAIHQNHEAASYAGRLLEFRDLLASGYLWPEWCAHFRGGLGAPYFTYYQPGFFYAASLAPWRLPATRALGLAVAGFALLGYWAMFALVRRRFGALSGWVAASGLLLSAYAGTEIYVRGDLTEFSAMMTLPVALWALAGWFDDAAENGTGTICRNGPKGAVDKSCLSRLLPVRLVCLTLSAGALILLHPAVALIAALLLGAALVAFLIETRQVRRVAEAAGALGLSVGLSAFYWLPVFGHWNLISPEKAFTDFYHYSQHFVNPLALLGPYHRQTTIPLSLGPLLAALVAFNTVAVFYRRGELTPPQRRLLLFSLLALAGFTFLMTRASEPLWRWIPPLQRLQFPWRILTVVTVLSAAAAGSMLPWRSERSRSVASVLLVAAMCAFSWQYTRYERDASVPVPQSLEELTRGNFAPDLRDEWLPRGAEVEIPADERDRPLAGPGCRVEGFQRHQGLLACRVFTTRASFLVLPHYFFPVGWEAALAGQPVPLRPDPRGLMRVDLPPGVSGQLEVRFGRTPMRRAGLLIAALSLALGVGFWTVAAWRGRKNSGARGVSGVR